mmetsp:Transcript_23747/g.28010  ORF Transcript_23747/g.28010 Transcript_23747/m.28010 type:complete len:394 (+) Transcript_23747:108-1289(+)
MDKENIAQDQSLRQPLLIHFSEEESSDVKSVPSETSDGNDIKMDEEDIEQDQVPDEPLLPRPSEEEVSDETSLPSEAGNGNDEANTITNGMDSITEVMTHVMHIINHPSAKKMLTALTIFVGSFFATEGARDEWKRNNSSSKPPSPTSTRLERVTFCASHISASVGVGDEPFNGGDSPQVKAIDWFVAGPGRPIPINVNTCPNDEIFTNLYSLQILKFSANIINIWGEDDGGGVEISSMSQICHWNRIACDEHDNHITRLHLSDLDGMKGTIPAEIALLSQLVHLEMYDNPGLVGNLPPAFSKLTNLEYLYVHHTSIGGTIPSSLGALVNLEELFMEDTKLKGSIPDEICSLRKNGTLKLLHADCKGEKPVMMCTFPSCCTNCYGHNSFTGEE